jgi:hypothetical protein
MSNTLYEGQESRPEQESVQNILFGKQKRQNQTPFHVSTCSGLWEQLIARLCSILHAMATNGLRCNAHSLVPRRRVVLTQGVSPRSRGCTILEENQRVQLKRSSNRLVTCVMDGVVIEGSP